jgi:hypothetical protein
VTRIVSKNAASRRRRESNPQPLKNEAELVPSRAMYSPERNIILNVRIVGF